MRDRCVLETFNLAVDSKMVKGVGYEHEHHRKFLHLRGKERERSQARKQRMIIIIREGR